MTAPRVWIYSDGEVVIGEHAMRRLYDVRVYRSEDLTDEQAAARLREVIEAGQNALARPVPSHDPNTAAGTSAGAEPVPYVIPTDDDLTHLPIPGPSDPATGLRLLADWFDIIDRARNVPNQDDVQRDLRRWADQFEAAQPAVSSVPEGPTPDAVPVPWFDHPAWVVRPNTEPAGDRYERRVGAARTRWHAWLIASPDAEIVRRRPVPVESDTEDVPAWQAVRDRRLVPGNGVRAFRADHIKRSPDGKLLLLSESGGSYVHVAAVDGTVTVLREDGNQ